MGGALLALLQAALPVPVRAQVCTPQSRPVVVTLNSAVRLQMSTRKPLRTVNNPKEGVLAIRTLDRDPTTVLLVGQQPGITRLELEDADGARETIEIHVQADVEYLASQLRRGVPWANIQALPNGLNTVILTGYVGRAEDVQVAVQIAQGLGFQVINGLRLGGVQQVQLDVVVARVARGKTRDFGFNFLQNSPNELFGSTIGAVIPTVGAVGVPGSTLQPARFGQIITSAPGNANLFGGIIGPRSGFLGFLQALEQENLAKLIAQPRLVTLSGNPASFLDGGEQAVPIPAGLGQVGVQFEEFGTRLNFLPIVLGNGKIHLEVEPEVSILSNAGSVTLVAGGNPVQGRQTQRVHTTVELESGQTFVIGGLIQHQTDASTTKIPVLGQLPFVGVLFSTKQFVEEEHELVVMITPYLVDAQSCDQLVRTLPGQETRSPDDFELFLEGILEAPRGPREVCPGNRYVPAHKLGPTANLFPCAGRVVGTGYGHGAGKCAGGGCPQGPVAPPVATAPMAAPAVRTIALPVSTAAPASLPVSLTRPALPPTPVIPRGEPLPLPGSDDLSAETPTAPASAVRPTSAEGPAFPSE